MGLTIALTPGKGGGTGEAITTDKLNAAANPTVDLAGTIGSVGVADGAVTTAKLADGALSADAPGRAKMADGFVITAKLLDGALSADATGRAKMADGFVTAVKLEETARA